MFKSAFCFLLRLLQSSALFAEAASRQFSQKLTDEVVSSYLIEPESNRFGLINAFANAAQKLGPLQRIEMERFAGTLLEAPLQ